MFDKTSDIVQHWEWIITDRRTLAKAGALFTALQVFDFTIGNAQTAPDLESNTRATDWYESDDPDAVFAADIDGFVTVYADFPFTAIGASWNGEVGRWPLIEIQTSYDGGIFGDLTTLPADADSGYAERDDRVFTRLLFANGETVIRYRTTDRNGLPTPIPGFGLTWIDASSGPSLDDLQTVEPADITTPPAIISRASWGADEGLRFSSGIETYPRAYELVSHAVVHHSETSNTTDQLQEIRSIYYFHAITRDWGDIGYNYLVDRYGNVYEGRVGGQNVIGNHSLAYNVGAAGICLIGNYQSTTPPSIEISGLVGLLAWICRDLDPLGFSDSWNLDNLPTIASHRDVTGAACPGDHAYAQLSSIRTAVANTIASSPASPAGGFVIGDLVSIDTKDGIPVNLRNAPGLNAPIVTGLADGILGSITGAPSLVGGINWYPISTSMGNGWIDPGYLEFQPAPLIQGAKFSTFDIIAVDRATAVLLEAPVSSSPVVATYKRGTKLSVQAGPRFRSGKIWYHLYLADVADPAGGWGDQNDFVFSSPPSFPVLPVIGDVVTTTDSVNFRSLPSLSGSIIRVLPRGTEGAIIDGPRAATNYNWFQLQTAWGQGWAVADFLQPTGATVPTPTPAPGGFQPGDTVRNPSSLNLRTSPTTGASVIALMTTGTIGTVISGPTPANSYSWYQISTSYGTGWAAGELLVKTAAAPTPQPTNPPAPSPTPTGGFPIGSTVKTTTALNMRSTASLSGTVLAVLISGTIGTVLTGPVVANGYSWYRIQTTSGAGWVAGTYLVSSTPPAGIQIGSAVHTTTALRLRTSASSTATIITTMPTGTRGTVIAGPISANGYSWWQLQTNFGSGWAAGSYLALD